MISAPDADLELRMEIVGALRHHHTQPCANLLLAEFGRVKSSNTTRSYLREILRALSCFPADLVDDGLGALAADRRFTPRMREKFRLVHGRSCPAVTRQ